MDSNAAATIKPKAPSTGMKLAKKKTPAEMADEPHGAEAGGAPEAAAAAPVVVNPLLDPVNVEIVERVAGTLSKEGSINGEVEFVGSLTVTVADASKGDLVCFKLAPEPMDSSFKYKVHPNLNKTSHAKNILEVRDLSKAFKANAPAPLLKWQKKASDDGCLPLQLSCWPNVTSDGTEMVLEYELSDPSIVLQDVQVSFPAAASSRPSGISASPGEAAHDGAMLHWTIDLIDKDSASGQLEFTAAADEASLLPFTFQARSNGTTRCPIDIVASYHQSSEQPVAYGLVKYTEYDFTVG